MISTEDEFATVCGIPVRMKNGVRPILFCKTGEINTHRLRMMKLWKTCENDLTTVIEFEVKEEDVSGRLMYITVDFGEPQNNDSYHFTTSKPGILRHEKVGIVYDPNHPKEEPEMKFVIELNKLTGDYKQILQLRRYHEGNTHEVLIDFVITVIPEAKDKVTDKMLAQFAEWLVKQNIYGASDALSQVGCYSQPDLEELTLVDIENLDLPELTKRKLLKLKGYPSRDCAWLLEMERDRKRRQSAVVSAGSGCEGDASEPQSGSFSSLDIAR